MPTLQFFIKVFAGTFLCFGVKILPFGAVCFYPFKGSCVLFFVEETFLDPADDLGHVDVLHAHSEPLFPEICVDHGTGNAHGSAAHGKIGFVAHDGHGEAGTGEIEDFFRNVFRNLLRVGGLDILAVNPEGGKAFLGMSGKDGGKVDRSRTLRPVEAPDRLRAMRIHVHGFRSVAPAGRHRQGNPDILFPELIGAGIGLRHATDAGIG